MAHKKNTELNSRRAASAAFKVLRIPRASKAAITAADSALAQPPQAKGRFLRCVKTGWVRLLITMLALEETYAITYLRIPISRHAGQGPQRIGKMPVPPCHRRRLLPGDSYSNDSYQPKGYAQERVRR